MKIAVYNYREDERAFFEEYAKKYGVSIKEIKDAPGIRTAELAKGCACISVTSDAAITPEICDYGNEIFSAKCR